MGDIKMKKTLDWQVTPWIMDTEEGGWKQQPVILIEKQTPFFADHPNDYITKLQEMHDDPKLTRGVFHTLIGQFKDALEQSWKNPKVGR